MKRRKILIFIDSFLPGYKGGGPVTSIANLVNLLNKHFDVCIVTRNHDFGEQKPYDNILFDEITKYRDYNVIYLSKTNRKTISKVIQEFNPDLLYVNSLFATTTQIVMFLNKTIFHKKMILAPRGELQENALEIKKTKKSIYLFLYKLLRLYKNTHFHSTDTIETHRIRSLFGISQIRELSNAVKVHNFKPLSKKENELKLIFVSRIAKKKNLDYALEVLRGIKSKVQFDIYGPREDAGYWKQCKALIGKLPKNIEVHYKGSLKQDEIVPIMRKYHAFFFPTKSENFGHVIVEAMQSGLVPIISDQTPWVDLEDKDAGWDIALNDENKFVQAIEKLYGMDNNTYEKLSEGTIKHIQERLNMDLLEKQYVDFFNEVMNEDEE